MRRCVQLKKSLKRAREESPDGEDSNFIMPNKTARARSSSGEVAPLSLSTAFDPLREINNLMVGVDDAGSEAKTDAESDVDIE